MKPRWAELVGPPGAGKSSVLAAVASGHGYAVLDASPFAGRRRLTPALRGTRAVLEASVGTRRPPSGRQQTRWWARLGAYDAMLERYGSAKPVVVDQGPIYTLSRLVGDVSTPSAERWWNDQLARWTVGLEFVAVLDASDEELLTRIDRRTKSHALRGADTGTATRELARQRTAIERTVERLESLGVSVIWLHTDTTTIAEAAASIVHRLGVDEPTNGRERN